MDHMLTVCVWHPQSLRQHIAGGKTLATFSEATPFDKNKILETPCDVLIPAAIGGVITEANAGKLDCKLVIEAANGPTTPEGDKILRDRGITVLPGETTIEDGAA